MYILQQAYDGHARLPIYKGIYKECAVLALITLYKPAIKENCKWRMNEKLMYVLFSGPVIDWTACICW
jgi:hypothetical protein